jgi:hypothetical protein
MPKLFLKDKAQFDAQKSSIEDGAFPIPEEPESYPCVIAYHQSDNPNGRNYVDFVFVYPADFQLERYQVNTKTPIPEESRDEVCDECGAVLPTIGSLMNRYHNKTCSLFDE